MCSSRTPDWLTPLAWSQDRRRDLSNEEGLSTQGRAESPSSFLRPRFSAHVRVRLLFRRRDREAEILPRQMRRRSDLFERIERAWRSFRLPPAKVAEASCLEPQLDAAF